MEHYSAIKKNKIVACMLTYFTLTYVINLNKQQYATITFKMRGMTIKIYTYIGVAYFWKD